MENNVQKINTICIACGDKLFDFFANKNKIDLYRCKNCRLIFTWPMPQNAINLYSSDYFSGAKNGFGYVNYDEDKLAMVGTFCAYLDRIEQFIPQKGRILDVGAATGFFMRLASERGWSASGVEISDYAAKVARYKGLDVFSGTIESANFNSSSFDVVTLWDVLEHLTDPLVSIKIISGILKQGGIIAVNTPDSESFIAKIFGKKWHLLVPPEHLFYFNYKSLSSVLRANGFDVIYVSKIGKKFTLQYILDILNRWQNFFLWRYLSRIIADKKWSRLGTIGVSINLRDNFFIIARKV